MTTVRKLSVPTMFSFGIGQAAGAFKNIAWGALLLFYYQQLVGVEAWLVGLAIAISVIVDAITDPLIGAWSDRVNTRWGRRHPMLVAAALPLAVSFVLLFSPPAGLSDTGGFLWLLTFGILVRVSYTFYDIPHMSLGAEMAQGYHQRTTLFAYCAFLSAITGSCATALINGYYFPTVEGVYDPGYLNPDAYPAMSQTFAIVMVAAILLCVAGTRREIPHLRPTQVRPKMRVWDFFTEIWEVLKNRSFRAVFLGLLFASLVLGVELAAAPYMGVHFWGLRTEQLFYLAHVGFFAFPVAFALTPVVTRWLDKRLTVMLALAAAIVALNVPICLRLMDVSWFPGNDSPWILVFFFGYATISALVAPMRNASTDSMLADVVDEHELDTDIRREGVVYAVRAFSMKATAGFGTLLGGVLLSAIEFPENVTRGELSAEMTWNLGFIMGPATSIFSAAAILFYLGYRIDAKRHGEIMAALERRRASPDQSIGGGNDRLQLEGGGH